MSVAGVICQNTSKAPLWSVKSDCQVCHLTLFTCVTFPHPRISPRRWLCSVPSSRAHEAQRWGWPQALEEMAEPTRRTTVPVCTRGWVLTCEESVGWQTPGQGHVATRWSLLQPLSSPTGAWAATAHAPVMGSEPRAPSAPELCSHATAATGFSLGVGHRPHPSESEQCSLKSSVHENYLEVG